LALEQNQDKEYGYNHKPVLRSSGRWSWNQFFAGLEGIQKTTETDLADAIVEHIEREAMSAPTCREP